MGPEPRGSGAFIERRLSVLASDAIDKPFESNTFIFLRSLNIKSHINNLTNSFFSFVCLCYDAPLPHYRSSRTKSSCNETQHCCAGHFVDDCLDPKFSSDHWHWRCTSTLSLELISSHYCWNCPPRNWVVPRRCVLGFLRYPSSTYKIAQGCLVLYQNPGQPSTPLSSQQNPFIAF